MRGRREVVSRKQQVVSRMLFSISGAFLVKRVMGNLSRKRGGGEGESGGA